MTLAPAPAPSSGSGMIESNALRRGLATLIDFFLVNGLVGYLILPGLRSIGIVWPAMDAEVLVIVSGLYFMGLWLATGQTIGKKLFRLRVIQLNGYPVSFLNALVRYLGYITLPFLYFLGAYFVGFIFLSIVLALVNALFITGLQRHQAIHDIFARTMVVKAR